MDAAEGLKHIAAYLGSARSELAASNARAREVREERFVQELRAYIGNRPEYPEFAFGGVANLIGIIAAIVRTSPVGGYDTDEHERLKEDREFKAALLDAFESALDFDSGRDGRKKALDALRATVAKVQA